MIPILDALGRAAGEHPTGALAVILTALALAGHGWLALAIALGVIAARRISDRLDDRSARRWGLDDIEEDGR